MKKMFVSMLLLSLLLVSCRKSEEERAAPLLEKIESLYAAGNYRTVLDSITRLRHDYPRAIEARRQALKLWQDASLKLAQEDIGRTDSALQAVTRLWQRATTIASRNQLRVKVDSLQTRYEALIGSVRIIHRRQQEP